MGYKDTFFLSIDLISQSLELSGAACAARCAADDRCTDWTWCPLEATDGWAGRGGAGRRVSWRLLLRMRRAWHAGWPGKVQCPPLLKQLPPSKGLPQGCRQVGVRWPARRCPIVPFGNFTESGELGPGTCLNSYDAK